MRYVYMLLIAGAIGVLLLFKIQNLSAVTLTFLGASMTLPVSFLVLGVYLLGMLSGGAVVGLLRSWARGATSRSRS